MQNYKGDYGLIPFSPQLLFFNIKAFVSFRGRTLYISNKSFADNWYEQMYACLVKFASPTKRLVWWDSNVENFQVDFFIDKNMIHIADTKVDRRYGDYFIRQILKYEEQNRALKLLKMWTQSTHFVINQFMIFFRCV